jgi:hypothetical protein
MTFLTTAKMSRELAARVESSVRGKRIRPGETTLGPVARTVIRFTLAALVIGGVWAFFAAKRSDAKQFDRDRAALVDRLKQASDGITQPQIDAVKKDEQLLVRFSTQYDGDTIELQAKDFDRTMMYVRGPLYDFASTAKLVDIAKATLKDPLLSCLIHPPSAKTEKAIVQSVRNPASTPNVVRFADAETGTPFLAPAYAEKVRAATTEGELAVYKQSVDRANLEATKPALRAELLLAVMDEPGPSGGITEMDGERPHDVRIYLVERASQKVLLRLRKWVDPSGWTADHRAQFASGMDGCALAFDIREKLP